MDSFNFYDIKAEKANAILRSQNKLGRKISNLFRLVEVLVVLVLVSRLSLTIPTAVKNSGGFLKNVSVFFFSPRFVFFLGNLIVLILFAKSGQFSPRDSSKKSTKLSSVHDNLYDEFVERSEKSQRAFRAKQSTEKVKRSSENNNNCLETKSFVRSNSNPAKKSSTTTRVLKRSQTEKNIENKMVVYKISDYCDGDNYKDEINKVDDQKCSLYPEDLMSGEEFRSKVEAFIARQQRFRSMEEEFSGDELD